MTKRILLKERNGHIHELSDVSSDSDDEESKRAVERDANYFDDSFQNVPREHFQSFKSFDICKPLLKALSVMGFKTPTPIQQAAIPVAMMGKDVCEVRTTMLCLYLFVQHMLKFHNTISNLSCREQISNEGLWPNPRDDLAVN